MLPDGRGEDVYKIEESNSDDEVIPRPAVESALNRKANRGSIRQKTTAVMNRKTTEMEPLDSLPDGALHKVVKNKNVEIRTEMCLPTKLNKGGPVIVDQADGTNDTNRLANNIKAGRSNSLKNYFQKNGHIVSNSASRKQKAVEDKKREENAAKRPKSEGNSEDESATAQEDIEKRRRDRLRRERAGSENSAESKSIQSGRGSPVKNPSPGLELTNTLGNIQLKDNSPKSVLDKTNVVTQCKETESNRGLAYPVNESLTEGQTFGDLNFNNSAKKASTPKRSRWNLDDCPFLPDKQPLQQHIMEADEQLDIEENTPNRDPKDPNMEADSPHSGYRPVTPQSPVMVTPPSMKFEEFINSIGRKLAPSYDNNDEPPRLTMIDPNLEEEEYIDVDDSPEKPKTRAVQREIETNDLLLEGERALKMALEKEYVLLPDLHRRRNDVCMINIDSLSPENPSTPIPNPPHASPREVFYGQEFFVDCWWSDDYVSEDGLKLGTIIRRELNFFVKEGFQTIENFAVFMNRVRSMHRIDGLLKFYGKLEEGPRRVGLLNLLHKITILAARAPELITRPIPLLYTDEVTVECSITLSQEQCASILASSFLGLMPVAKEGSDCNELFLSDFIRRNHRVSNRKLPFILSYFASVVSNMPDGVVTFRRVASRCIDWKSDKNRTKELSKVYLVTKPIEKCQNALQVDFANQYIGGGVCGHGFVQEEIRFLCYPEMLVSLLIFPKIEVNEAIFIAGAQEFSSYTGYASTTKMIPLEVTKKPPRDKFRRIINEMVAIDATFFRSHYTSMQYRPEAIDREIRKAFVGFNTPLIEKAPVATGNWGCGAFNGDLELKCIIQLIAATMAEREILYSAFDQTQKIAEFCQLVNKMRDNKWLLGDLSAQMSKFKYYKEMSLFQFLSRRLHDPIS